MKQTSERANTATNIKVDRSTFTYKAQSKSFFFQPKLTIGPVDDAYEREADAVADKVMRMSDNEQIQTKISPINVQRKCAACEEEEQVQRKEQKDGENLAGSNFNDFAENLSSGGTPLSREVRNFYEPRFGYDFSSVKIHTGTVAAKSAQSINALAYTSANNIVFNEGQYSPNTDTGKRLLGHELTHVVQQQQHSAVQRIAFQSDSGGPGHPLPRQAVCANPGSSRTLDLQPVFLRLNAADAAPTGGSWTRRFNSANTIWNKLGVTFVDLGAITLDTPLKTNGTTDADINAVRALRSGPAIEIFLVDNDMTSSGGASKAPGPGASCGAAGNIVMSDRGTSNTLMAHELGHILGLQHPGSPPNPAEAGTVMEPSSSHSVSNPTRNTIANANRILCPAPSGSTCLHPDP